MDVRLIVLRSRDFWRRLFWPKEMTANVDFLCDLCQEFIAAGDTYWMHRNGIRACDKCHSCETD